MKNEVPSKPLPVSWFWLPLTERNFVLLCIASIVVIRLATILATPRTTDFADIRIYQGAGQTVLAGVNPYDFSDQPAMRRALRARMTVPDEADEFTQTQASWDYYVSGNLPASTALYAAFEAVARGSRTVWRGLFILGDIAIFAGLYWLVKSLYGRVSNAADQAGIICLTVINPVLILSGTALPEDKQFQTALLLFSAALVLSPAKTSRWRGLTIGAVLSLSVMFKLFGIFLFPLWLARAVKERSRFIFWTALGALVPILLSFVAFGHYFIGTMLARGVKNSIEGAEQASPWTLIHWLSAGSEYLVVKIAVVLGCAGILAVLLAKRRIDLLNFCAGIIVIFACLWLDKGAMNRMNIAIMFAIAALVAISRRLFLAFSVAGVLIGIFGYALGIGVLKFHPQDVDAVFTLLFLVTYFAVLVMATRPSAVEPRVTVNST